MNNRTQGPDVGDQAERALPSGNGELVRRSLGRQPPSADRGEGEDSRDSSTLSLPSWVLGVCQSYQKDLEDAYAEIAELRRIIDRGIAK